MQSLCEALCTHHKKDRHVDDMDLDMLDRRDRDRQLEKNGLDVIDRYRRMDEWAGSFQNLYSRTALDCQRRLSDCRVGTVSAIHFLQYTRPGNYDMLRLAAFDNLIQPDMFQNAPVLHYIIFCMSSDPSPWIRTNLQRSFGKILATLAIGDGPRARRAESAEELVIETDLDAQSQQTKAARKRSIEVALAALKLELGDNEKLARSLWAAVNSKVLTLHEILTMLDFCRMLYDPLDSFVLKINYPRYWEVEHLGKVRIAAFSRVLGPADEMHRVNSSSLGQEAYAQSRSLNGYRSHRAHPRSTTYCLPKSPDPGYLSNRQHRHRHPYLQHHIHHHRLKDPWRRMVRASSQGSL